MPNKQILFPDADPNDACGWVRTDSEGRGFFWCVCAEGCVCEHCAGCDAGYACDRDDIDLTMKQPLEPKW